MAVHSRSNIEAHTIRKTLRGGMKLAWDAKLEEDIKALNPDVIVTALRRHVDPAKLTIIEAGNFAESSP
jgi:zinc protease